MAEPDLSGQIGGLGYATNITDVEMRPRAQPLFKKRRRTYEMGPLGTWSVSTTGDQLDIELSDVAASSGVPAQSGTVFVFPSAGGTSPSSRTRGGEVSHCLLTVVAGH